MITKLILTLFDIPYYLKSNKQIVYFWIMKRITIIVPTVCFILGGGIASIIVLLLTPISCPDMPTEDTPPSAPPPLDNILVLNTLQETNPALMISRKGFIRRKS